MSFRRIRHMDQFMQLNLPFVTVIRTSRVDSKKRAIVQKRHIFMASETTARWCTKENKN